MGEIAQLFGFGDLESVPFAVGLSDTEGVALEANDALCRLFGRDRAELVGQRYLAFTHPDDRAASLEVLATLRAGVTPGVHRKRIVRPDGATVWVDLTFAAIRRDGTIRGVVVFMQDVSELQHTIEALRQKSDKLDRALELADDGIWEWDVPTGIVTSNQRLHAMMGLPPGTPFPDSVEWQAMIHPADAARVHAGFERLMTGDGHFHCEYRLRTSRGEVTIIDRAAVLERDADGAPLKILGTVTDVTAQRAAEEAARHSQRIDALGRLAGGVAHDIANLLTAIGGNASMLRKPRPPEQTATLVSDIELAIEAASNLTRNLLAFSTRQAGAPEPVAVGPHVETTTRMLRRLIGEAVELRVELGGGDPVVMIDRGHVDQILVNLVVNARDAMPSGGAITITVDAVDLDAPVPGWPRSIAGRHCRITVADQGTGMSDEVREHLFEPFFTTKPRDFGTGLGLSTVHGIVEQRRGSILVETAPGAGTTFRVHLPVIADAPAPGVEPSAEWVRGDERIVLVDDDRLVRDMLARTLESFGYQVTTFASAQECLQALPRVARADLLITDLVMPGVDGRELARRVREVAPDIQVLLISGDAGRVAGDAALPSLAKPFGPTALARKIREVLS